MAEGLRSQPGAYHPPVVGPNTFVESVLSTELGAVREHQCVIGGDKGLQRLFRVLEMAPELTEHTVGIEYYAAFAMHGLYRCAQDQAVGPRARRAMKAYVAALQVQPDRIDRLFGALDDFDKIETLAATSRDGSNIHDEGTKNLLSATYTGTVPRYAWKVRLPMADPVAMLYMLRTDKQAVNIESVGMKSVEVLDRIAHEPANDVATFRLVQEIYSFYAPLCDFLGYKPLAMALRSQAELATLRNSGQDEAIQRSKEVLSEGGDIEEKRLAVVGLLSLLRPGQQLPEVSQTGTEILNLDIASGEIVFNCLGIGSGGSAIDGDGDWREKGLGSRARKIADDGYAPVDDMGVCQTTRGTRDLVRLMTSDLREAQRHPEKIELCASGSRSRGETVQVRGKGAFVNVFMKPDGLPSVLTGASIETKRNNSTRYQVAKMTLKYIHVRGDGATVPVMFEIQYQTLKDYRAGKYGKAARPLRSAEDEIQEVDDTILKEIVELGKRKTSSLLLPMTPASVERGKAARARFGV